MRVEQLCPFPFADVAAVLERAGAAEVPARARGGGRLGSIVLEVFVGRFGQPDVLRTFWGAPGVLNGV